MVELISLVTPDSGNFLVSIIKWLVTISGSVAVGIILFTVALKLITLPFDYISRASMRKNSLKMEAMRPELEKLQKQYANNKDLYNQKMMALYKKNGYSMWGACLPTIITLVIFIVAINAFNAYGQYQNSQYFYDMTVSYNSVIINGIEEDGNLVKKGLDKIEFNDNEIYRLSLGEDEKVITGSNGINYNFKKTLIEEKEDCFSYYYTLSSTNGYIYYQKNFDVSKADGSLIFEGKAFNYYVLEDKLDASGLVDEFGKKFSESGKENGAKFIEDIGKTKSAERFRSENTRFLWVKNIWVKDSPLSHPVSDYESFKTEQKYDIGENNYAILTEKLETEKNSPNGYFILCVITAGISFLTQFVSNKGQKAMDDLQTVDGQGAQSKKMMMIMMPIMMAVFSFIYTAAFSLYIVISSGIGILTTLLINWITTKKYQKETVKVKGLSEKDGEIIRGRIYVEKEEPKKEKEKKKKKEKVEDKNKTTGDFLTGPVDKKKK